MEYESLSNSDFLEYDCLPLPETTDMDIEVDPLEKERLEKERLEKKKRLVMKPQRPIKKKI
jgi:hypothetical protein